MMKTASFRKYPYLTISLKNFFSSQRGVIVNSKMTSIFFYGGSSKSSVAISRETDSLNREYDKHISFQFWNSFPELKIEMHEQQTFLVVEIDERMVSMFKCLS